MKTINDGKGITLKLSFQEAAIITEALRKQSQSLSDVDAKQAGNMVQKMMNEQDVRI